MNRQSVLLLAVAIGVGVGCSTPDHRIDRNPALFESFTVDQQEAIRSRQLQPGFSAEMVRMAWGEPSEVVTRTPETTEQEIWSYPSLQGRDLGPHATYHPSAGRRQETPRPNRPRHRTLAHDWARVVFEDGVVTDIQRVVGR